MTVATAVIADDEQPMREQLRARLREAWPELAIVAEAANGAEAVDLVARHRPDIAFLDIRMPVQSGIEAARQLFSKCHIVFVTAYEQYAIEAFERGAADYLLKPVDAGRLGVTCDRLRARLDRAPPDRLPPDLTQLLAQLERHKDRKRAYLRWVQASVGSSLRMISTREILFFRSDEKYTRVQTEHAEVLIRKTIRELEDELDPDEFWRIHRSTLVRVDAIVDVTRDLRGRQMVQVRNHPERLEVSRSNAHLFQQM